MQRISFIVSITVFSLNAYASGGVYCKGSNIQVSWGTSHMTGSPRYGNPLTIEIGEKKETIQEQQIVGYYVHSDMILLLALDKEMNNTLLDLRYNSKNRKPSFVVYDEKRYSLKECLFE